MHGSPSSDLEVTDLLGETPAGAHGHDAVREILTHPARYGVANLLEEQPRGPSGSLELLRGKYKPGRKLTAYYRSRTGSGRPGEHVAVTWSLPQAGSPENRLEVLVSPDDPAMPQLERLTHVGHVASLVEQLTGRPVAPAQTAQVATVRYRPRQRHVLVARLGNRLPSVYVKTDRDRSGAHAVPTAELVQRVLARSCPDVRTIEPVGYSVESKAALWRGSAGRPLSHLIAAGTVVGFIAVGRLGRALRATHDDSWLRHEGPAVGNLQAHDARAEAFALLRTGEHIQALLPVAGSRYSALVSEAARDLERLPAEAAGFAHGDFKSDNILVHLERPRILDFDRCCWAEPAMDLGKLLADLAWWCPVANHVPRLHAALHAGYGPCDPIRWKRAERWAVLFRLKFAARRCALQDHDWPAKVQRQITAAGAALLTARRPG
ncbi:MAG: phosphotransferase family protein [Carbonactinosporaceae bacterium]